MAGIADKFDKAYESVPLAELASPRSLPSRVSATATRTTSRRHSTSRR